MTGEGVERKKRSQTTCLRRESDAEMRTARPKLAVPAIIQHPIDLRALSLDTRYLCSILMVICRIFECIYWYEVMAYLLQIRQHKSYLLCFHV